MGELPNERGYKWSRSYCFGPKLWCWSWKSQANDGVGIYLLCISFVQINLIAQWHCLSVSVHSRNKFKIVYVFLVSLLGELLEHYMLFLFPLVNASSVGGRRRGFTLCSKDIYFRSYFSDKKRWCLNNTWQASAELTAILHYVICLHDSLKIKMNEPKKYSFNFRKWDLLAFLPYLSFFF